MNKNQKFPWWGIVLGAGCLCIICVGGILGLGGFVYYYNQTSPATSLPEIMSTNALLNTAQPIVTPTVIAGQPLVTPSVIAVQPSLPTPQPTSAGSSLTGKQELTEYRLYDDFSSNALGWPVFDDGKTIIKYEDGQYGIQIKEKDYTDWAFVPVNFTPFEIWFDIKSIAGPQNGTAGVFCQYQDENNYYYVEFDLGQASYVIGQYANGENIALTPQNAQGQYWQDTSKLDTSPGAVNRIGIGCYQNFIVLFINDEWMMEATVQKPADKLGEAAFFVYAYPFAGADGYKVYFDNVEVYKPVQ
jgi:hypothetical protein